MSTTAEHILYTDTLKLHSDVSCLLYQCYNVILNVPMQDTQREQFSTFLQQCHTDVHMIALLAPHRQDILLKQMRKELNTMHINLTSKIPTIRTHVVYVDQDTTDPQARKVNTNNGTH